MPAIRTKPHRQRSTPYNLRPRRPAFPGRHTQAQQKVSLSGIKKRVTSILAGKVQLPQVFTLFTTTPYPLSQNNKDALEECLSRKEISLQSYRKEVAWGKSVTLVPDSVLMSLNEQELSERAIQLDTLFKEQGPDKFRCKELGTVLINMCIVLKALKERHDCYAHKEIQSLIQRIQQHLESAETYHYTDIYAFVMQYILFYETYRDGIETINKNKDKRRTIKGNLSHISQINFSDRETATDELRDKLIPFFFSNYPKSDMDNKYLIWPSFEPLDIPFFVRSLRYNIKPAGLLVSRWGFHDDSLMGLHDFYRHDITHCNVQYQQQSRYGTKASHKAIQGWLSRLETKLEEITTNKDVKLAVWLFLFQKHHEMGSPVFKTDEYEVTGENLTKKLSYFDQLPDTLHAKHFHAALEILNFLDPQSPSTSAHTR
ncbi:hypothetical protein [Parendozoicomonas sp. Alg238-R29]|uniref:hypothetical protein n=1 Tax=Parendozoicomonas sp. Alg238-R29 TaxID=2993446 RepID=UPI00248D8597|nr:hypothetical protein [Parendozoicomonas sp. Alg238-R29]